MCWTMVNDGVGAYTSVVDQLIGTACEFCEDGNLESGRFKGDLAVLCESCGTPAFRTV